MLRSCRAAALGALHLAARFVLDGIRSALAFEPAGFDAAISIARWGYSGGPKQPFWRAALSREWSAVSDLKPVVIRLARGLGMRSDRPRWLLDELATAGRENLDPDHVARYDDKEDAHADAEVEMLTSLGLEEGSSLVDLGAGTGQLALAVAPRCGRVVAVDVSPVMLDVIRAKLRTRRLSNVEVVQAGFCRYEHQGKPADFIYTRWALHHLPDFWKSIALTRMRTVVGLGGILRLSDIVYSFPPSEAEDRVEQWCATLPDHATQDEWVRADIEEHVRDEHSTYTWLLEPMIERSGFRIDHVQYSSDGFEAEYIATAV